MDCRLRHRRMNTSRIVVCGLPGVLRSGGGGAYVNIVSPLLRNRRAQEERDGARAAAARATGSETVGAGVPNLFAGAAPLAGLVETLSGFGSGDGIDWAVLARGVECVGRGDSPSGAGESATCQSAGRAQDRPD